MLSTSTPEVNLGKIPISKTTTFSVQIKNNATYSIHPALQIGCGSCTTASLVHLPIPANSTTTLTINYTPTSTGTIPRTVTLSYLPQGSQQTQFLAIRFKGEVS